MHNNRRHQNRQNVVKEEKVVILDYLPNGHHEFGSRSKGPVAQAIGINTFVLLELAPKKDIQLQPYENVYIGEGKREKIHHIISKISYNKLTETAKQELLHVVEDIVKENEKQFVDFFNKAQPLSTRMHQLELLPGLGKKHMWEVIEQRKEKPFESFEDIKNRIKLMTDPAHSVMKRIIEELKGNEKHNLFVRFVYKEHNSEDRRR